MNYIVGSGPAGVAAALALIEKRQPVTMLDAGHQLEPERQEMLSRLQALKPEKWPAADIDALKAHTDIDLGGVPLKHAYGSAYHISGVEETILEDSHAFLSLCSLAQGGLSAVWGGAILPYTEKELESWPVTLSELAPHYEKILAAIPHSARRDALEAQYPVYSRYPSFLKMSPQAESFYGDLEKGKVQLEGQGLFYGASRLAVRPKDDAEGPGCVYCGLCLYGCPYGLIYNAADTLARLRQNPDFHYQPGVLVDKIKEDSAGVQITGRTYPQGQPLHMTASRVFLACGVLSTARIMLNSMETPDKELTVQCSQHFYLPLLRWKAAPVRPPEGIHTLAQIFIEYIDKASSRHNVHLQVYTFNDLYAKVIKKLLGPVYRLLQAWIERHVLSRLLVLQGYLHSDYSPTLTIRLDAGTGRIRVTPQGRLETQGKIDSAASLFFKNARILGALPILPLLKVSDKGVGAHLGGTFPMRKIPGPFETDILGTPSGFRHVHIVDASVFPNIPPTTITLAIMANAHRIASMVDSAP